MNLNRNKIIFIMTLAVVIVGASFYFFSEQKEYFPPPERVIQYPKKEISVYISGQVKNPAVVTFEDEENLKIVDAVNAAGGLTEFADTEFVNLSEPLNDGQHIHIPTKKIIIQEVQKNSPTTKNKSSSNTELININTNDENELQKIRGVGPAIAKRILDFREQNGDFEKIEDIKKVRGIGEKTFEKIKDSITVQ